MVDDARLCLFEESRDADPSSSSAPINKAKSLAALSVLQSLHFEEDGDSAVRVGGAEESDLLGHYLEVANIRIQELFEGDLCAKRHHKKHASHGKQRTR